MPSATVTNTFQTQSGNVPASQIDANFTDLTTYLNVTHAAWITSTVVPGFAASSAQVSAATATAVFITPASAGSIAGTVKGWAAWNGTATGTITGASTYGVASIVRVGLGTWSVTLTTAFTTSVWVSLFTPGIPTTGGIAISGVSMKTVSSAVLITFARDTSTTIDCDYLHFAAFGDTA